MRTKCIFNLIALSFVVGCAGPPKYSVYQPDPTQLYRMIHVNKYVKDDQDVLNSNTDAIIKRIKELEDGIAEYQDKTNLYGKAVNGFLEALSAEEKYWETSKFEDEVRDNKHNFTRASIEKKIDELQPKNGVDKDDPPDGNLGHLIKHLTTIQCENVGPFIEKLQQLLRSEWYTSLFAAADDLQDQSAADSAPTNENEQGGDLAQSISREEFLNYVTSNMTITKSWRVSLDSFPSTTKTFTGNDDDFRLLSSNYYDNIKFKGSLSEIKVKYNSSPEGLLHPLTNILNECKSNDRWKDRAINARTTLIAALDKWELAYNNMPSEDVTHLYNSCKHETPNSSKVATCILNMPTTNWPSGFASAIDANYRAITTKLDLVGDGLNSRDQSAFANIGELKKFAESVSRLVANTPLLIRDAGLNNLKGLVDSHNANIEMGGEFSIRQYHMKGTSYYSLYGPLMISASGGTGESQLDAGRNLQKLKLMYSNEFNSIASAGRSPLIGLALSGGGIRSGSFALGVLQSLNEIGMLTNIGYLSTVSGGGYIGLWYMSHLNNNEDSENPVNPDKWLLGPGSSDLKHLSQYGYFLASGHYSSFYGEMMGNMAGHLVSMPIHWTKNILLNNQANVMLSPRETYYKGLGRAYNYRTALDGVRTNVKPRVSMYSFLPNSSNLLPYWIINTHAVLNKDSGPVKNRSGDLVEITPQRAGGTALGYVNVLPEKQKGMEWMEPLRAVTISGAAVDSGSLNLSGIWPGITWFFNFNMGYYIDNWGGVWDPDNRPTSVTAWHEISKPLPFRVILGAMGAIDALPEGIRRSEDRHYASTTAKRIRLTDGAHFENLGLYALIRRGCRVIIVVDGEHDPEINKWTNAVQKITYGPNEPIRRSYPNNNSNRAESFDSLARNVKYLTTDMGAQLNVPWDNFHPYNPRAQVQGVNTTGWFICTITNLPITLTDGNNPKYDEIVTIIYIKSSYLYGQPLNEQYMLWEKEVATGQGFPQETTENVNFSEQKFHAYRELGRHIALGAKEEIANNFTRILNYSIPPSK